MSDKSPPPLGDAHLINPTVRRYMESTNLERFYGGYVIDPLPDGVYNLGIGEVGGIPLDEQPYDIYKRFLQSDELARRALRYSGTRGEMETNRLMAERLNAWLGVERFHEGVVVSADGGQNAANLAIRVFTSPLGSSESAKQYVLLAAPSYPYFSAIISANAGLQSFLAYDDESLVRGIETYCNPSVGVILLNAPHNPMGYGLDAEQVRRINRVAQHYDCAIVADIVYANYARGEAVGHALGELDPERTVFLDSFSKKYGYPGLRLGFAVSAAERLTYAMRFVKMSESLTPSNVKLAFAGHLLANHGGTPAQIAREITERHDRFVAAFTDGEALGVRLYTGRPNPFYLAADVSGLAERTGLLETEMAAYLLHRHNVKVFPGQFIYPNEGLPHEMFSGAGQPDAHGPLPFKPPQFPAGAQIVYAPNYFSGRVPLLRLSFGMETRAEEAATALRAGLEGLWKGERPQIQRSAGNV